MDKKFQHNGKSRNGFSSFAENIKRKLITKLKSLGAIYLRGRETSSVDIDFYVNRRSSLRIERYLLKENFVLYKKNRSKVAFFKIVGEHMLLVDLALNFDYIFRIFNKNLFKKEFIVDFLKDPIKYEVAFNTLRYLFIFRNGDKHTQFFKKNKKKILENSFYLMNLTENPFKKELRWENLDPFLNETIGMLFKLLKFRFFSSYIKYRLRNYACAFNNGQTIAFLGADGVGKTTIITKLNQIILSQKIYMGSKDYILHSFYPKIMHKNKLYSLLYFLLIYSENLFKSLKVFLWKLKGTNVLTDRYPLVLREVSAIGHNGLQKKRIKGIGHYLNVLFYNYFFPKPDKMIVLCADPKKIIKRKHEKSIDEINKIYRILHTNLKDKRNVYFVKNDEINIAMREIINIVGKSNIIPKYNENP